ncbi:MAG: hypothetical protein LUI87_01900 [Lachnospiraceae bacterium]|nr:hypothetical protein [Lachnospiraceae bacterium]
MMLSERAIDAMTVPGKGLQTTMVSGKTILAADTMPKKVQSKITQRSRMYRS